MTIESSENVHVARDGGIVTVTLDRPPVNSLTFAMCDRIRKVFHDISHDESVRVVLLKTAGEKAFIAGNDVKEFVDLDFEAATDGLARVRITFNAIYDCPVPVIALVDGGALGSGLCIATLCDVRLASESAVFALPEIDVGVLGGSKHAMRVATQGTTRLMLYTGRRIPAERAFQLGMIDEVHPHEELESAGYALAEEIASKSPAAIRLAKQGLNRIEDIPLKPAYEYECTLTAESRQSPEASEAAKAWLERRQPDFANHR